MQYLGQICWVQVGQMTRFCMKKRVRRRMRRPLMGLIPILCKMKRMTMRTMRVVSQIIIVYETKQVFLNNSLNLGQCQRCSPNENGLYLLHHNNNRMISKMRVKIWIMLLLLVLGICEQCEIDQSYIDLMDKQLSFFNDGITNSMVDRAVKYSNMIKVTFNNGQITTSKKFPTKLLLLLRQIAPEIPNLSFAYNYIDEPRVLKGDCEKSADWKRCACDANFTDFNHGYFIRPCNWQPIYEKVPVLSAASIPQCYLDIIIPSRYHVGDHLLMKQVPWQQKQFKAIWRGSSTGGMYGHPWCSPTNFQHNYIHFSKFHRHKLVGLCQKIADCDAKFHQYRFCSPEICQEMEQMYGKPSCILMENQAVNKLIIDIDGFTYSRRFPLCMATGSVVIKIATFTDIATIPAKPWEHYIPVKIDLSDLEEKIQWAKQNDKELEEIGKRGRALVYRTIKYKHYKCHIKKVLQKYHRLWVSEQVYQENLKKKNNLL